MSKRRPSFDGESTPMDKLTDKNGKLTMNVKQPLIACALVLSLAASPGLAALLDGDSFQISLFASFEFEYAALVE